MGDVVNVSWSDRLKMDGVLCKGFGIISKYTMLDRDLSLTAKSIYAYLCSLAGNGDSAFPGRDTIVSYLDINKETFYTHFKQLTDQGYISVEKQVAETGRFAHNIYCIESNPKKFVEETQQESGGTLYGSLAFSGIKSAGFGMIPRAVMSDDRLSVKAKGLYAYFASYTGAGRVAFPRIDKILYNLHISKNRYYQYLKELTSLNYITVIAKTVNGRRDVNDYYLVDKPDAEAVSAATPDVEPCIRFPDTVKPDMGIPYMAIPDTGKQDTGKQDTGKQDTGKQDTGKPYMAIQDTGNPDTIKNSSTKNKRTKNTSAKINLINQQAAAPQRETIDVMDLAMRDIVNETQQDEDAKLAKYRRFMRTYYSQDRQELKQDLQESLGYEDFAIVGIPPNIAMFDTLVELILDAVCSKGETITISGEKKDKYEVADVLFSLTKDHFNYVLDSVSNTRTNIKNIKAYYLKCLYEAPRTYELYEARQLNAFMAENL